MVFVGPLKLKRKQKQEKWSFEFIRNMYVFLSLKAKLFSPMTEYSSVHFKQV